MATRTKPEGCCAPVPVEPLSEERLDHWSALAKALADPNRLEILRLVARQPGPLCACDIVGHVELSQPTVSHHLKILKDAGLLQASRSGLWMFYSVDPGAADALAELTGVLAS